MTENTGNGCPCGLQGDACDQTEIGVNAPLEDFCAVRGFDSCSVEEGVSECVCKCGNKGDLCEERINPLVGNFGNKR